ncbi:MAG: hypothetical protein DME22_19350 [Verrucomicrobia bacterium]|nr:MAG: hypothetical protein DME22_19350 [Verrucomicrobiota bacterium]PYJ96436.1 MAG: hypothetical protein DME23_20745 [Verrucomicrobiota bacterium]
MRVFISWSGELSKQVAELLATWIEDILQGIQTWISTEDIDKGSIWFTEISGQLTDTGRRSTKRQKPCSTGRSSS